MMRNLLSLRALAAIIVILISGCGDSQSSAPPAPGASPPATTASPGATPGQAPTAANPLSSPLALVTPASAPPPPGLIRSTNAEQREKEVKTGSTSPPSRWLPVPIQKTATTGGPLELPKLEPTEPAALPDFPVFIGPKLPPRAELYSRPTQVPTLPDTPNNGIGPKLPPRGSQQVAQAGGQQVPGVPDLPQGIGPKLPNRGGRGTPAAPQNTGRGTPAAPQNTGRPQPGGSPQQVASAPLQVPKQETRQVPTLPDSPVSIGPKLPGPTSQAPLQVPKQETKQVPTLPDSPVSIGPKLPPTPPTPVAQAPAGPPPPPEPTLARGVEVTGVVQVGNETQIILKSPNEASSRYVKVGQRLANGQVLVKRVENIGGQPIVILEQNGVEVAKTVGAPPAAPTQPGTATS